MRAAVVVYELGRRLRARGVSTLAITERQPASAFGESAGLLCECWPVWRVEIESWRSTIFLWRARRPTLTSSAADRGALEAHGGNKAAVARAAGVDRGHLYRLLKKYRIGEDERS